MTIIFFILFYWLFSYLFLLGGLEWDEDENTWYKKLYKCIILYIIGGFLFPMILGDILKDILKHFKIRYKT